MISKKVQLAKLYTHVDGVTVKNYLKPKYDRSQTPEQMLKAFDTFPTEAI